MMKNKIKLSALSVLSTALLATPLAFAETNAVAAGIEKALSESTVKLNFRARYEGVDQDGIDANANALTLKSRITVNTGSFQGLSAGVEVDNVTDLIDNYNSTANGATKYPAVADPTGTDVNQIFIKYSADNFSATAGRQRILHNNQRFVGGVGWRQNEQTYDGYRLQFNQKQGFSADYSYVYNVNRIFGPDGANADLHGQFHLLNTGYVINQAHKVNAYAYLLDFDTKAGLSTDTYGLSYQGNFGAVTVNAAYATQRDAGDNSQDFSANYYNFEVGTQVSSVTLLAGIESLGSDNGVGFSTPLATLHKFQGFADKFLGTPGQGVEDIYLTVKTTLNGVKLAATYHDLSSDVDGIDYGSEIDLAAAYSLNKHTSVLVKLAHYNADDHASDTDKLWLQVAANF
ncbi:Alginate export [Colwellia chukchiensis]|uniref:Alginate export n=1 Tax=Colwellia chukchiensis TaxID=641665 RepID=A0A1H7QLZ5_9GAMM|nr:alginate export family protein [Colwellia chukchiensis]SEL48936.1 Alginate export [Colwellia chukchiensis]